MEDIAKDLRTCGDCQQGSFTLSLPKIIFSCFFGLLEKKMLVTTKNLVEELEEIKKSLNFMLEEISKVVKQQVNLMSLMEEVHELRATVKQRDQKIQLLEQRIDDLEQCSRADDFIITGMETKHRSYARTTAGDQQGEDSPPEELHTLEQQVVQFMKSKRYSWENQSGGA